MKTLYLIRHAKSSWDDANQTDFERPLNKRGEHDAPIMSKALKEKNVLPDLIISSPAARALATAEIFAEELHYPIKKITTDERIYESTMRELTGVVKEINDEKKTVLLFGHNPVLTNFTNLLGDKYIAELPTCAVVGLELNVESWEEVGRHCGKIFSLDYPKKHHK
ncbi:MAG: histidine phosphatase family protein [Bacteroidota bacterium]